jgi:GDPmannose 4,6-dehydratase
MKTALITGISGFVGPYLAKKFLADGWTVFGLVRHSSTPVIPERLFRLGIASDVKLLESDVTDLTSVMDALDKSDPGVIVHLAAQSYVPRSFVNPLETLRVNTIGTANILEAIRLKELDTKLIFAGSSEEYGLQFSSRKDYDRALAKYGAIFPPPREFPELPIRETNTLRPMSPYAVSKVQAGQMVQNYHYVYGMRTVVSRGFNHEGAGRGHNFVTASIVSQGVRIKQGEADKIVIGNVNAFRDWSHVLDVVDGYFLLAEKGVSGEVYVQGSMRTNSVLTYLLMSLDELGYRVEGVETLAGKKCFDQPLRPVRVSRYGISWDGTALDNAMLDGAVEYEASDKGLVVNTSRGKVTVEFDSDRFRPAEVPVLLSDTTKMQSLGYETRRSLREIIKEQINYYSDSRNRVTQLHQSAAKAK